MHKGWCLLEWQVGGWQWRSRHCRSSEPRIVDGLERCTSIASLQCTCIHDLVAAGSARSLNHRRPVHEPSKHGVLLYGNMKR